MSAAVMKEQESKSINCMYRYLPQSPGDGYYELTSGQDGFLENIDPSELPGKMRKLREQGYDVSVVKRGGPVWMC